MWCRTFHFWTHKRRPIQPTRYTELGYINTSPLLHTASAGLHLFLIRRRLLQAPSDLILHLLFSKATMHV